MNSVPSQVDVAIIGAGAAGLGAAHALKNSALSVVILEARLRVGGRAHTLILPGNIPFDEGCGWLHSADKNSFAEIAEAEVFAIDKTLPPWDRPPLNPSLTPQDRQSFSESMEAFHRRLEALGQEKQDQPASAALEQGNRWNAALDAISTFYSGAALEKISVQDLAAYDDSGTNWRVREGYGALVSAYARNCGCDIVFGAAVKHVDHSNRPVKLETTQGEFQARAAIITVPTPALAEDLSFTPDLPDKREAAANLPLGVANKVMLKLDSTHLMPEDVMLLSRREKRDVGSYHVRPFGRACIECYFGGDFAAALEKESPHALASQAIDEITALLGNDFRRQLVPLAASTWAGDPFARGSYSYAKPGKAGARSVLAKPVDDVLFFAGEATSTKAFSTAHGARDSGERAAREVLEIFKKKAA